MQAAPINNMILTFFHLKNLITMRYLFTFLICSSIFSLGFGQGAIFDSESYLEREALEATRGYLPSKVSYAAYAPPATKQYNSSCVAHAFGNAMVTGLMYHANNIDDSYAWHFKPSPLQIYVLNSSYYDYDCSNGLNMEKVARYLEVYGATPQALVEGEHGYWPYGRIIWGLKYPYSYTEDMKIAYRPSNIYRVNSIQEIKTALYQGKIVVAGASVTKSFENVSGYSWTPSYTSERITGNHAITIIGYNDNVYGGSVLVLNSWGKKWGVDGKTWVRYSDAQRIFRQAYAVDMRTTTYGSNGPVADSQNPNTGPQIDESDSEDEASYGTKIEDVDYEVNPEFMDLDFKVIDEQWELLLNPNKKKE